jgi:hypothetical protein
MNMRGGAVPVAMVVASPAVGVSLADCDAEDAERIPGQLHMHMCLQLLLLLLQVLMLLLLLMSVTATATCNCYSH